MSISALSFMVSVGFNAAVRLVFVSQSISDYHPNIAQVKS